MKRFLAVTTVLLVPIGVMVLVLMNEQGFPEHARSVLRQYTDRPIQQVTRGTRPWNFTAAMSAATFGQSARFQTTHGDDIPTARVLPPVLGTPGLDLSQNDGRAPLPYPPEEIWCARLEGADASPPAVVLVAYHQDLYNGAWIVHEPGANLPSGILSQVGCDLPWP